MLVQLSSGLTRLSRRTRSPRNSKTTARASCYSLTVMNQLVWGGRRNAGAGLKHVLDESMVSLESRRYMRGENGTESLMVC